MLAPRLAALGGDGGGDMPKQHSDRGARNPPHFTLELVHKDTGKVHGRRERYGIHEIVHSSPKGAKEGTPECIIVLEDLRVAALNLLKKAGEKMPADIVGSVEKERPDDVRAIFEALYNWQLDIEKRHWFLSPLSMAARFLTTGYGVSMVIDQPTAESTADVPDRRENDLERKMMVMAEFAHVWRRWHMEVFGEHKEVYVRRRQTQSLVEARQTKKELREKCLARYLKDKSGESAGDIAKYNLTSINSYLNHGHKFPSESALKKAILRFRKANKLAKSKGK